MSGIHSVETPDKFALWVDRATTAVAIFAILYFAARLLWAAF